MRHRNNQSRRSGSGEPGDTDDLGCGDGRSEHVATANWRSLATSIGAASVLALSLAAGDARAQGDHLLLCRGAAGNLLGGSGVMRLGPARLEVWDEQARAFRNACADRPAYADPSNSDRPILKSTSCDIRPDGAHLAWASSEPVVVMGSKVTLVRTYTLDLDVKAMRAREVMAFTHEGLNDFDDRRILSYACARTPGPVAGEAPSP